MTAAQAIRVPVGDEGSVSGLWMRPPGAKACLVLAHGAGAGMTHAFMAGAADSLCARGIASLRFQFPYMDKGAKRPDSPALAHAAVRAAVVYACNAMPDLPLFAGGKSFGGRMTSQAQAIKPLPGVHGLVFLGFPLHPANKSSVERAKHLSQITIPMLFVQGDRDALAEVALLKLTVEALAKADLRLFEGANHAFVMPKRLRQQSPILDRLSDAVSVWMDGVLA